jgi:anaerobic selenocysteine-containing dehydrogenase
MERKMIERRTVLKGSAAAAGILGSGASAATVVDVEEASAETAC